jgi:hypothetical protein
MVELRERISKTMRRTLNHMKDSTKTTVQDGKTKFEQDLQVYFPDLYQFWSLFNWDKKYEFVMQGILEMVNKNGYGTIRITYQGGKIVYVNSDRQLSACSGVKKAPVDDL